MLITPPGGSPDEPWWTLRDREEELVAIARQLKADRRAATSVALDAHRGRLQASAAVSVRRAPRSFGAAGIPYRMSDALPLAAEPTSAALDLMLDAVSSRFSRSALDRAAALAALRDSSSADRRGRCRRRTNHAESVSALDRALSEARYLGELERLEALAAEWTAGLSRPAMAAALARLARWRR